MSDYISIKDDRLWDILFDEACVEGKQAERIQKELEQISVDETEIIRKAFERIIERLEEERATENFKALKNANETFIKGCIDNRVFAYIRAIEIVKEECGINE